MQNLKTALKSQKITITKFGETLGTSRMAATRIVSGKRFKNIKLLFQKIYDITKLTPNDILGIPAKKESGES